MIMAVSWYPSSLHRDVLSWRQSWKPQLSRLKSLSRPLMSATSTLAATAALSFVTVFL